jgi:hypothetical protein
LIVIPFLCISFRPTCSTVGQTRCSACKARRRVGCLCNHTYAFVAPVGVRMTPARTRAILNFCIRKASTAKRGCGIHSMWGRPASSSICRNRSYERAATTEATSIAYTILTDNINDTLVLSRNELKPLEWTKLRGALPTTTISSMKIVYILPLKSGRTVGICVF